MKKKSKITINTKNTTHLVLIGGSKKYGSGKVIKSLNDRIRKRLGLKFVFIETQEKKFGIVKELVKIPRKSLVIFQPSVALPSFLRDCFILLILRLKRIKNLYFILLVDLKFNNILFQYKIIRRLIFGQNIVFAPAEPSFTVHKLHRLTAKFFEINKLTPNIITVAKLKYCFVNLGYRNHIKGWEHFLEYTSEVSDKVECVSIGSFDDSKQEISFNHVQMLDGPTTLQIQQHLQDLNKTLLPIYIFTSNFDFAPLMVLEAGYWGVPVCVVEGSEAHHILNRFIPSDCFHVTSSLRDISLAKLISAKVAFANHISSISEIDFSDEILEKVMS